MKLILGIVLAVGLAEAALSPEQQKRSDDLQAKLLAPCCYREPVGIHQSEIAVKMRVEIARMVGEGKTDSEIIQAYVQRYGKDVLSDFAPAPGWAPWIPWGLGLLGGIGLLYWLPRLVRRPAQAH